jgi:hypothetical protein
VTIGNYSNLPITLSIPTQSAIFAFKVWKIIQSPINLIINY